MGSRHAYSPRPTLPFRPLSSLAATRGCRQFQPRFYGSHTDSVPAGGNYDGQVGSLAAIEVAQNLAEHGIVTRLAS